MMNADRKIKERCEDYKALPALSLENDRRTHLLSNLTEIEVPKVSSIGDLHGMSYLFISGNTLMPLDILLSIWHTSFKFDRFIQMKSVSLFKFSFFEYHLIHQTFSWHFTPPDLLNSQLSEYLSQCSSSYGEAALQLELEQSRILKERLEEQLEHLDRNVHAEEEQVVAALDSRLSEVCMELGPGREIVC